MLGVVSIAVQTFPDAAQPLLFDNVLASALLLFEEGVTDTGILFPAVFDVLARFTLRHGAIQLASLLRARSSDAVGRYIKCFVQSVRYMGKYGEVWAIMWQYGKSLRENAVPTSVVFPAYECLLCAPYSVLMGAVFPAYECRLSCL